MLRFRTLLLAVMIGSASFATPAAAQYGNSSPTSMTHLVSVTVAPRVKVRASPLSVSAVAPAAVKLSSHRIGGIDLSVNATQAWVLSIRSASPSTDSHSPLSWSSSPGGDFSPLTSADTVLVAGSRADSSADTAVFFSDAPRTSGSADAANGVFLTVSAP